MNIQKMLTQQKNNETLYLIAFSERAKKDILDLSRYFVQTVTDFLLASAENTNNELFLKF